MVEVTESTYEEILFSQLHFILRIWSPIKVFTDIYIIYIYIYIIYIYIYTYICIYIIYIYIYIYLTFMVDLTFGEILNILDGKSRTR